jgi:hypothetical protein
MSKEFRPTPLLTLITIITFSFAGLVVLTRMTFAGALILAYALKVAITYIYNYRKYVVTDSCLQVLDWFGKIRSEIEFVEVANMYLHKSYGQAGQTLRVDIEKDTLVIDLLQGGTARFDITPINNSDELVTLVKSKWNH